MPARKSPSGRKPSARRMLACELARLREESGKSLSELADGTTYDRSYLHKLERGEKLGSPEVVASLDRFYDTGGHLGLLWQLAREDAFRDKYKQFMQLESEATVRHEYLVSTVPGLLQSEAYARELLSTARPWDENEVEEHVAARMSRQSLLDREGPPDYRVILDEAVLRRPLHDAKPWREQLERLLTVALRPNVIVQVLPFSAGLQNLLGGSVTLLWLADGSSVAYEESATRGELVEDPAAVEKLRLSYDRLRDAALSPQESVEFIQRLMEDGAPCEFPDDPT